MFSVSSKMAMSISVSAARTRLSSLATVARSDLVSISSVTRSSLNNNYNFQLLSNGFKTTCCLDKAKTGRYKRSLKQDKPLTYEQFYKPHQIAHHKGWNSYNTENLNFEDFGVRSSATAIDDQFIRKFMTGTWHNLFLSEIIIKRQHNIIRIIGIIQRSLTPRKVYFLIGYTEELLSYWLQCPVKLELQSTDDRKDVVFKYV